MASFDIGQHPGCRAASEGARGVSSTLYDLVECVPAAALEEGSTQFPLPPTEVISIHAISE